MSSSYREENPNAQPYRYDRLKNLTKYSCENKCLCRFNWGRSSWDEIQQKWFVDGEKPNIPMASKAFAHSWGYR